MKKLLFTLMLTWVMISTALAQDSKIMVGASARIFGPACTNCTAMFGIGLAGGYAITDHIVGTLDIGIYSKVESSSKLNSTAVGVSGDYYLKEAFKGFYIGPDITYISINQKYGTSTTFSQNNMTIGLNLGWAIPIGERIRIIPHFGYGSWYENSKGRITIGAKFGFRI